ncbi:ABC transporter ATP-binding protein [Actinomyces polynesiensis]|uniref:ABC transporter ATP-binding protein n=1 Tax=Actinomyces polynesiensis TaxID=1325934 RepID=UPI00069357A9|nr:ATP-binding cassette domain-containing protein [Actinomyces polynesiensis]
MPHRRGAASSNRRPQGEDPGLLLDVRQVTRTVSGLRILSATSLKVRAGTCTVLRGENGSGKTTLLRVLLGLDAPTTGSVRLVPGALERRDIAHVIQPPPFFEDLTVLEHLLFVRASWGLPSGTEAPLALLRAFDAERLSRHFPDELSSGERQVVALCLGLARPARVLVLDEPEQRLDTGRRRALGDALRSRIEAGLAVVMATHAPDLTDAVADEVLTLSAPE